MIVSPQPLFDAVRFNAFAGSMVFLIVLGLTRLLRGLFAGSPPCALAAGDRPAGASSVSGDTVQPGESPGIVPAGDEGRGAMVRGAGGRAERHQRSSGGGEGCGTSPSPLGDRGVSVLALVVASSRAVPRSGELAEPIEDPSVLALAERWRQLFSVRRKVRLLRVKAEVSPFTLGVWHPVIVLPASLGARSAKTLESVIAHEMAHVARFDDLQLRIQNGIRALWFFHPVVWLSLAAIERERESARDAEVLRTGWIAPVEYARGLFELVSKECASASGIAAFGTERGRLLMRFRSIVDHCPEPVWRMRAVVLVVALLVLPMSTVRGQSGAGGELASPLPGATVTSPFGDRANPFSGEPAHHDGVDLRATGGTAVLAPADGVVLEVAPGERLKESDGVTLVIGHDDDLVTVYTHLRSVRVEVGERVRRGEPVATVGATGKVTGPASPLRGAPGRGSDRSRIPDRAVVGGAGTSAPPAEVPGSPPLSCISPGSGGILRLRRK